MRKLMMIAVFALLMVALFAVPAMAHPGHVGAYDYGCGYWQPWYVWSPYSGWWIHNYQWCHNPWGYFLNWGSWFKL